MLNSTVVAIVPAFNEEKTIGLVIANVLNYANVIVVDDGSSDNTKFIAEERGAIVVSHQRNLGYEAALETGFAKANRLNFGIVITLDADGQHDPSVIEKFTDCIENGRDVVIGVRDQMQRFGESLFAKLGSILWKIDDPLCGMKAYRIECVLNVDLPRFDSIGTKYAVAAARSRKRIGQIPISTRSRSCGAPRFGSGWNANKRIIVALIKTLLLRGR